MEGIGSVIMASLKSVFGLFTRKALASQCVQIQPEQNNGATGKNGNTGYFAQ